VKKIPADKINSQIADETLIGEYSRSSNIRINESDLIAQLKRSDSKPGIMIDVGAHLGSALSPFLEKGWKIFAFEPDEKNRVILEKRYENQPNLVVDPRAVSDQSAERLPFFTSSESTGISSLAYFDESHKKTADVSSTTLGEFCREHQIDHINFLLVDAEGYDLLVLKGLDWSAIKPDIIICEFEDSKTGCLGYTFHDMAEFLQDRGYEVLVSEWHPILRYGIAHDWHRLAKYPCELNNQNAWGNLIACRDSAVQQELLAVLDRLIQMRISKSFKVFAFAKIIWRQSFGRFSKQAKQHHC
jgi:FkbM family methyltransferase